MAACRLAIVRLLQQQTPWPGARQFATTTGDKSKVAVVGDDGDSVVEVVVYVPTGTLWVWCV